MKLVMEFCSVCGTVRPDSRCALIKRCWKWCRRASIQTGFNSCTSVTLYRKWFRFLGPLYGLLQARYLSLAQWFDGPRSIQSEMSINFLSLSLDGLPLRSASTTESVSQHFSVSVRTALRWGTAVCGNVSAHFSFTKSVYLLPSRKTYSTRKTRSWIQRTTVSKNWITQLHSSPVLHFNRCLTTECSETTAHFNGNLDTDNHSLSTQPLSECTV
jgi:hypothetical protein